MYALVFLSCTVVVVADGEAPLFLYSVFVLSDVFPKAKHKRIKLLATVASRRWLDARIPSREQVRVAFCVTNAYFIAFCL